MLDSHSRLLNLSDREVDLSNITSISWWNEPLANSTEFKKLNFGECDLSTANFDDNPFLNYWNYNESGEVILLGAPMNYKGWVGAYAGSYNGLKSTITYNLEYDYSDLFFDSTAGSFGHRIARMSVAYYY